MRSYTFCKPKNFTNPIKQKLYIYCSPYKHFEKAIDCIKEQKVHLSYSDKFNDPFDNMYQGQFAAEWFRSSPCNMYNYIVGILQRTHNAEASEILTVLGKVSKDQFANEFPSGAYITYCDAINAINKLLPNGKEQICCNSVKQIIEQRMRDKNPTISKSYKIACFSEQSDLIPMWAYYAGSHKGICVEFDFPSLDKTVDENKNILDSITKVQYSNIRPDDGDLTTSSKEFFIKSNMWSHEQEWRLVCATDEEYINIPCVSGIYLGAYFDKNDIRDKDLFFDLLKGYGTNIPMYKYCPDPNEFRLVSRPYTLNDYLYIELS
ncbi:MAG: DUF2971 domain-containing protein [Clostridiales bacterium]|nr:DUF2971 domain-containing protein [Clostridiales bacterium]